MAFTPHHSHIQSHNKDFAQIMRNLNIEIMKIKDATLDGLIMCAAHIRRETEKAGNIVTPVDLGNLRASWFVVSTKGQISDEFGASGNFVNRRGRHKKMQYPASRLKAEHIQAISEEQGIVKALHDPAVAMGYSAGYALWVHEMGEKNWKRPGSGAKWFQQAVYSNRDQMLTIIHTRAMMKK
jgi:hypothetical protein